MTYIRLLGLRSKRRMEIEASGALGWMTRKLQVGSLIGFSIEKGLEDVLQFARGSFPEIKQPRQLIRYCKSAGICVPSDYGKGMVTTWLDKIKPYSKSLKAWASAPPEIRETWRLVLRHNRFDVSCMYDLLVKIKEKEQQARDD
jgi:hypothetical protein